MATNLTPQDGTVSDQTPQDGTGSATTPSDQPNLEQIQQERDFYRQKFAASTSGAQQLWQENQAIKQRLLELEQKSVTQATSPKSFVDAVIAGDEDAIRARDEQLVKRAKDEAVTAFRDAATKAQREAAFSQYLNSVPGLNDPNSPLNAAVVQRYQEIMASPYSLSDRTVETLSNGAQLSMTAMMDAIKDVRLAQLSNNQDALERNRRTSSPFVEPSRGSGSLPGRGTAPQTSEGIFNAVELELFRRRADRQGGSPEDYAKKHWQFMDPNEKARRQAAGRA